MNKKFLIISTILLLTVVAGFTQDTGRLSEGKSLKNNAGTLNHTSNHTVNPNHPPGKPYSTINPNAGIVTPATTTRTLNSNVNPNTLLVIPIQKNRKKLNPRTIPDSGKLILIINRINGELWCYRIWLLVCIQTSKIIFIPNLLRNSYGSVIGENSENGEIEHQFAVYHNVAGSSISMILPNPITLY